MDKKNKAIKYRVYPDEEQKDFFANTFGACRKIYNLMLSDKITYYEETGKMLNTTPAQYKEEYPFLREVDSLALANAQKNLEKAYKNFFKQKNAGFPKFKSAKYSKKRYTTNNQNGTIELCDKAIKLPKVGKVKAKLHRIPKPDWKIKSATVSKESDNTYYISVLFEYEEEPVKFVSVSSNNTIGLDYKSNGLYMDDMGNIGTNHKFFRESQKKLAKAQRKLKNMQYDSKNYWKQQQKIAKIYRHTANQRKDNLHKISTEIANQYDIVCVEDLNMKAMSNKGFGNGKATMDNGFGMFVDMLEYKLADRGKYLVKVDKWYPSTQTCSSCGHRRKLKLNERIYVCPVCGLVKDRDLNSAINIKFEGLRVLQSLAEAV